MIVINAIIRSGSSSTSVCSIVLHGTQSSCYWWVKILPFGYRLVRDPRANYKQSLEVLRHVKRVEPRMVTKSSLMLGLGETDEEVIQALKGKKLRRVSHNVQWGYYQLYCNFISLCTRRSTFQLGKRITFSGFAKTVMSEAFVRLTVLTQLTFKNHDRGLNNLVYL